MPRSKRVNYEYIDDIEDDNTSNEETFGYECLSCGNIQDDDSGGRCDRCDAYCLEPMYF